MYLRVVFDIILSDLYSLLVNVYFAVCNMFLHSKRIFENKTGNKKTEISRFWVKWPNFNKIT